MGCRMIRRGVLVAVLVAASIAVSGAVAWAAPAKPTRVECGPNGVGEIQLWTLDVDVWGHVTTSDIRDTLSGQIWTFTGDQVGVPYVAAITDLDPNRQYALQMRYTNSDGTS